MLYPKKQDIKLRRSHGEQDVLWPVFLVCGVVVPTVQVRELSVTCAVEDACLLLPRPGEGGIAV